MSDVGGSSQPREIEPRVATDEEPRDIHVVREQLIQREPSPLTTVVSQEYEPEYDPEEDSEESEDSEEVPITSIEVEMYEALYDRNVELQGRIRELEIVANLRQTAVEQKNNKIENLETRLGDVEWKLVHEENQKEELLTENENMKAELEKLKDDLSEESAKRARAEDAWMKNSRRAEISEERVRAKRAKIEETDYTFQTAIDKAQDRVLHYPLQFEDLPWYMLDRRTMFRIMEEERRKAVRHLCRP